MLRYSIELFCQLCYIYYMSKDTKQRIYKYVLETKVNLGYPPTYREIASALDLKSVSTVSYHVDKLVEDGLLTSEFSKNRSLAVANTISDAEMVPLVGEVSAGTGMLATENIEDHYPLPTDLFCKGEKFLLRVNGDSMIDVGIFHGDFVVVRKQPYCAVGEIAVVLWENEATIKTIACIAPLILHPENKSMSDFEIPQKDNPVILGKVVGCIKKY